MERRRDTVPDLYTLVLVELVRELIDLVRARTTFPNSLGGDQPGRQFIIGGAQSSVSGSSCVSHHTPSSPSAIYRRDQWGGD